MSDWRKTLVVSAVLLCASFTSVWTFVEEIDDSLVETRGDNDIWLIKFYAPWCSFCKQLDPVWHQVGSELKSVGSLVNVGKCDATANMALAKEFKVRGYPAIFMWKKNVKYNYLGPRTKDGIMDFADRVSGPLIRPLTSVQLFQHALSRHDVMFVYIGASSPLKGVYSAAAQDLIASTFFFSASRDIVPKTVSLPSLPAVVVFKDGTYFTFNEVSDGELKAWINKERFPNYMKVDSYTLYAMGESDKLVLLALLEEANVGQQSLRCKSIVQKVAEEYKEIYSRNVHFGFMEGNEYINGLIMGELRLPTIVMLNLSTDSYFLPLTSVDTERHLVDFMDQVLDGSIQSQGGNGVTQRIRRFIYETKVTLVPLFIEAPLLGFFLLCFPLGLIGFLCMLCWKIRSGRGDNDDDDGEELVAQSWCRRKVSNKKSD
ncbi:protein disulfide-isomerase TMX3-like [Dunckerocampus dactyliophorus]|uniref:protein disulfide-isomerase TMX3-like n=1 Tax=Dunckerocampus dactyliophorus TaxID=161453 RepID=UPI0024059DB6|nr:protein disulfide-isomerase TMX3-like [Dunckerocampus dactyliophorus]